MESGLYFDYCATTPLHPEVRDAMLAALGENFGNPSSMHSFGKRARASISQAREQVAGAIGADPGEIFFTSGATESINLALLGTMRRINPRKNHLIVSAIEHHAVLHTAEALQCEGFPITILPVDDCGFVDLEVLEDSLRPETGMVSIMLVNNEVGTLQDIPAISSLLRKRGVLFHTDAVQALPYCEVDVQRLMVDYLSLSAHKMYGPKGIGALYARNGLQHHPLFYGGAQEKKLRPGTENVPGIIGLGKAAALRSESLTQRRTHLQDLRSSLISGLQLAIPDVIINGPAEKVSPHIISVSFPKTDGELLLFHLNQEHIAVSLGSACTSEDLEPSHVLKAMGLPRDQIEGTLRISLGDPTTKAELSILLDILPKLLKFARLDQ